MAPFGFSLAPMPDSYSLDAGPSQPLPSGIHWIGPNFSVSRRSKRRMGMVALQSSGLVAKVFEIPALLSVV